MALVIYLSPIAATTSMSLGLNLCTLVARSKSDNVGHSSILLASLVTDVSSPRESSKESSALHHAKAHPSNKITLVAFMFLKCTRIQKVKRARTEEKRCGCGISQGGWQLVHQAYRKEKRLQLAQHNRSKRSSCKNNVPHVWWA